MKRTDTNVVVGLLLAGAGILFLLLNLGLLRPAEDAIWTVLFVLSAITIQQELGR